MDNSHLGSPKLDIDWPLSEEEVTTPMATPVPKVKRNLKCPASPSIGQSSVKKKKTPQELARELVEGECAARLQMTLHTSKEKTKRELIKREAARNTALEIKRLRLKHKQKEADCQRAHELLMMDRQIRLEQLQAGIGSTSMPPFALDPQLSK